MWKKLCLPALIAGAFAASGAGNLLPNSSFEEWGPVPSNVPKTATFTDGQAAKGWKFSATEPATFAADKSSPKSGETALRITKEAGKAAAEVQYFMLSVKPETTYRFSVWIKSAGLNLGKGRLFAAFLAGSKEKFWGDKKGTAKYLPAVSEEWTEVTGEYTTGPDQTEAMVRLFLPAEAAGSLLVDDFTLTEVEK